MKNKNLRSFAAMGLACLILVGCTSLERVPVNRSRPEDLKSHLSVGETVIVRLQDGEQREFRIVALESDAVVGRDVRIAYRDIDLIDVKYTDYKGTAQATGAVALLALVVVGGAILDSEDDEAASAPTRCDSNGDGSVRCTPN